MRLIVAVDEACGIGRGGQLPWHLKGDLAHFVAKTTAVSDQSKRNALLMGRKCWESIPEKFRPLKGRLNVVVSRTMPERTEPNLWVRGSSDAAVADLAKANDIENVWNIGGGEIYADSIHKGLVDEIEITKIKHSFDADVFLRCIPWEKFEEVATSESKEENGIAYTFSTYKRK